MKKALYFVYGVACYVGFLGVFLYTFAFVGDFVPKSIDRGGPETPVGAALAINALLLLVFGLQHSVMARPTFKQWWTRIVPKPIERSTYVLATNLVLALLFWQWRPIPIPVWEVTDPAARGLVYAAFGAGWLLVFAATVLLNHFDLFGLRQVWLHLRGKPYTKLTFKKPMFYRFVRHPLYVGWMTAFWFIPTMTVGHLLFAILNTAYMLIAIQLEERNLIEAHGRDYVEYRRTVPMLVPAVWRRTALRADAHRSFGAENKATAGGVSARSEE